MGKSTVYPSK